MACDGAGVSSLGIAGRFITTGIIGTQTPDGTEYGETPGAIHAPSESRRESASAAPMC